MIRQWISNHITSQLLLANTWLEGQAQQQGQEKGTGTQWATLFQDNGSCVYIFDKIYESLRVSYPLLLTDGAVLIEASLSSGCEGHTDLLAPGIIVTIQNYTIRYTPYGHPQSRLHFTLNDIDRRGGTSAELLGNLKPIYACEEIVDALHVLRQTRAKSDRQCFGRHIDWGETDSMSPSIQRDKDAVDDKGSPNTQIAYGTQIAHRVRAPNNSTRKQIEPPANSADDDLVKRKHLLGLLNRNVNQNMALPKPHTDNSDPPSNGGFIRQSVNRASDGDADHSGGRLRPAPMPPAYSLTSITVKPSKDPKLPALPIAEDTKSSLTPRLDSQRKQQLAKEAEAEQASRLDKSSSGIPRSQSDEDDLNDKEPEWLQHSCLLDGCGKVPGAQQKLLSRIESWQKQRSGNSYRFPDANIPIKVLKALKEFSFSGASTDTESSEEEDGALFNSNSAYGEDDALSKDEDGTEMSWSRSPTPEPPKQPLQPRQSLPPDSSFEAGKIAEFQDAPRVESSSQEAQRVVLIGSSHKEAIVNPTFSPPLAPGENDSDLDMELDVPRGLGEDSPPHNASAYSQHVQPPSTVLVKETPYTKGKNAASASVVVSPAQVQQQASSGTSKDTSSTSIVYCTYKEPTCSKKDEEVALSDPALVPITANSGHKNHLVDEVTRQSKADFELELAEDMYTPYFEPDDVFMDDVRPETPRIYDASRSYRDQEQQRTIEAMAISALPQPSPSSAQVTRSPVKRKLEISPAKKSGRQSKRRQIKIVSCSGSSPPRDIANQLLREKEESMAIFRERERTSSNASFVSNPNTRPDAESVRSLVKQESGLRKDEPLVESQLHPGIDKQVAMCGDHDVNPADATHNFKSSHVAHEQTPKLLVDAQESLQPSLAPDNAAMNIELKAHSNSLTLRKHIENVDMDTDNTGGDRDIHSRTQKTLIRLPEATTESAYISDALTDKRPGGQPVKPATLFKTFKATYPEYTGDSKHFIGQCKQMEKLEVQDKMVPKWQWDDFIIRNRTDYKTYVNQCLDNGEDAEPYYRFYKDNIRDTLYTKGIIGSRKALIAAIEELEGGSTVKDRRVTAADSGAVSPVEKASISKASAASAAAIERPGSGRSAPKKSRQSLPSAFVKNSERAVPVPKPKLSDERPRQSLPASWSKSRSSVPPPKALTRPTPVKQPSRLSTPDGASRRALSSNGMDIGRHVAMEPTGDPYRDFVFAQKRVTCLTGSTEVDPDPKKGLPEKLQVRRVAEVKRNGYDVLGWKDEL
ncbi:hypothetical protein N0V90_013410 [Kalmusia sp. IMI 367209]|nr:hypothetical protein N0V90_013410 [Kalmusia sp. IMI 367209]